MFTPVELPPASSRTPKASLLASGVTSDFVHQPAPTIFLQLLGICLPGLIKMAEKKMQLEDCESRRVATSPYYYYNANLPSCQGWTTSVSASSSTSLRRTSRPLLVYVFKLKKRNGSTKTSLDHLTPPYRPCPFEPSACEFSSIARSWHPSPSRTI